MPTSGPPPLPGADLLARLPLPEWLTGRRARELVGTASLIAVAMVPGAAMAGGAITVAASAYCSFGSFCLYSGPDFDGDRVEYEGDQLYCQAGRPALNVQAAFPYGVRSIVNNTSTAGDGVGVKLYSEPAHLIVTSIRPGGEQRDLADTIATQIDSLCVYPNR